MICIVHVCINIIFYIIDSFDILAIMQSKYSGLNKNVIRNLGKLLEFMESYPKMLGFTRGAFHFVVDASRISICPDKFFLERSQYRQLLAFSCHPHDSEYLHINLLILIFYTSMFLQYYSVRVDLHDVYLLCKQ